MSHAVTAKKPSPSRGAGKPIKETQQRKWLVCTGCCWYLRRWTLSFRTDGAMTLLRKSRNNPWPRAGRLPPSRSRGRGDPSGSGSVPKIRGSFCPWQPPDEGLTRWHLPRPGSGGAMGCLEGAGEHLDTKRGCTGAFAQHHCLPPPPLCFQCSAPALLPGKGGCTDQG